MRITADVYRVSNVVDLYNGASGTWSTAQLSDARSSLAATFAGGVAIFAGGNTGKSRFGLRYGGSEISLLCADDACFEACCLLLARVCSAAGCRLMRITAGYRNWSKAVDLYSIASGTWSTAELSVARDDLAATSVGSVAIFAGGWAANFSFALCIEEMVLNLFMHVFWAFWLLLFLVCAAAGCRLTRRVAAGGGVSDAVDLYTNTSWSTAKLTQSRSNLAAASVGNVAVFAGGWQGNS